MSKKLQNIKAVNQMLAGEHSFQTNKTVGFSSTNTEVKTRLVGETWEVVDPKTNITYIHEQKNGYVMKTKKGSEQLQTVRDSLTVFNKCPKETCTCKTPNHLDKKMKVAHDMCFDCVIDMEHQMKKDGTFNDYAYAKMTENAKAWIERAERDVELLKQTYTTSYRVLTNSAGGLETLDARMTPDEFAEKVEREFKEYKEKFLLQLEKSEDIDEY